MSHTKENAPLHPRYPARADTLSIIDRAAIDALLEPWLAAAADRAFVLRCLLDEGPHHHRGANYVLLRLLGELVDAKGPRPSSDTREVPMQLPLHLAEEIENAEEQTYPLSLPLPPLDRLAPRGSREQEAMIGCLLDGPPQHALANVAMVCLLDVILNKREHKA